MQKFFCDVCKKEIQELQGLPVGMSNENYNMELYRRNHQIEHLCSECVEKMNEILKNNLNQITKEISELME